MATATRTVLFTDLAGYTARVSRSDRESLRKILQHHRQVVEPIMSRNGGRVVKNLGDSYMCLMRSATDGLNAGLEIIEAMRTPAAADTIRISVETGDVEEIDGDAFGEPVNLSARILSKTPAGELWFGPGTRACMTESELPWESVGRHSFKGIAGEPDIYRAVPSGRAWLTEAITDAIAEKRLVRVTVGQPPPKTPSDAIVLLERFGAEREETANMLKALPVLPSENIYLVMETVAAADRIAWTDTGRKLLIADEKGLDTAIANIEAELSYSMGDTDTLHGSETMVVTGLTVLKNMELTVCGLALPRVPFSGIVSNYSYDLMPDGTWSTRAGNCLMRVDVRPEGIVLHALNCGVEVDGHTLQAGTTVNPDDGTTIKTPSLELRYQQLEGNYAGVIFFESQFSVAVKPGQTVEIGRSPNPPGLALPSRPGKSNIRWCEGETAKRAKEQGFTLDRVLAGRRQASVHMSSEGLHLTPLHKSCPTYVLDNGKLTWVKEPQLISATDRVVAGTNVIGLRSLG